MTTRANTRTVQAVQNAVDIIEALQAKRGAGVTELASELDLSKGTVHSHLATLHENEYIVREDDTYRLSLKYMNFGETVKEQIPGYDILRNQVEDLAETTDELAQFATVEHGKAVYLYKHEGKNAVQTASSLGKREYLHCIALGKSMLAHMPRDRVDSIIDEHDLQPYTDETITSPEELYKELTEVHERGFAFDEEERIEGIRCVAAPVKAGGEIFGAVSVSGPAARMQGDRFREEIPDMVTRAANVIEINMKFS